MSPTGYARLRIYIQNRVFPMVYCVEMVGRTFTVYRSPMQYCYNISASERTTKKNFFFQLIFGGNNEDTFVNLQIYTKTKTFHILNRVKNISVFKLTCVCVCGFFFMSLPEKPLPKRVLYSHTRFSVGNYASSRYILDRGYLIIEILLWAKTLLNGNCGVGGGGGELTPCEFVCGYVTNESLIVSDIITLYNTYLYYNHTIIIVTCIVD